MNTQELITELINKKAEENNTIDLNAYALGLEDALKSAKYNEIIEMLIDVKDYLGSDKREDVEQLIKEATTL